jgi:hypothetical protein
MYLLELPMRRVWFHSALAGLAFILAGTGVAEASAVCKRLEAQLVNASSNAGSSAKYRRYADAVTKQNQQLRKVRADLSRYGCTSGSFIVLGGRNAKACAKLTAAQTKMRANLAALERKRDSFASRNDKLAKRRIQAALKANDCHGKRATVQAAALKGKQDAKRLNRKNSPGLVAVLGNGGSGQYKQKTAAVPAMRRRRARVSSLSREPLAAAITGPCACAVATAFSSRSPRPRRLRISPGTSAPAR